MRKIRIVTTFLLLTSLTPCLGQQDFRPGYVVKANRDSVNGFVQYASVGINEVICHFREIKDGQTQSYSPEDLLSYGLHDGKRFHSLSIEATKGNPNRAFVEVLVQGRINLFRHQGNFYVKKDSLMLLPHPKSVPVDTRNGVYMRRDKRYVGLLNFLMADCKINANKALYEAKDLATLIAKYNQCKGGSTSTLVPNKPWTQANIQVFAGFESSSLNRPGFETAQYPTFGISLDLSSPKLYDKLFFVVECWYFQRIYQGYYESQQQQFTDRMDFVIKDQVVKIPIGLRFNILPEAKTWYFKVGIFQQIHINPISTTTFERESASGIVTTSFSSSNTPPVNEMGYWAGIGYMKAFHPKFRCFGEFRAETISGIVPTGSATANFSILVGIRF